MNRSHLWILSGVLLATFLAALDATMVVTILPGAESTLGDPALYPWVTAGFLFSSTLVTPLFGGATDRRGMAGPYRIALLLFLAGSMGSALAGSMAVLAVCRVLQGAGAGGLLVLGYRAVAALFPPERRGHMQGILSALWGLAAVSGPVLGGLFSQLGSWRLAFWVNLPLGLVAFLLLKRLPAGGQTAENRRLDGFGLLLLAGLLLVLILDAGTAGSGRSLPQGGWALLVLLLWALAQWEGRTAEPLIPPGLLRLPTVWPALLAALLGSGALYGLALLVPLYLQRVERLAPLPASLVLLALPLGWAAGGMVSGRVIHRIGFRAGALGGAGLLSAGLVLYPLAGTGTPFPWILAADALTGVGMGALSTSALIAVQNSVAPDWLGTATALFSLSRNIGATLGSGILGGIQAAFLTASSRSAVSPVGAPPAALAASLHVGFLAALPVGIASLLMAVLMPGRVPAAGLMPAGAVQQGEGS